MELFLSCVKAFCVGGLFCVIGQLLIDRTKLTPARILTGFVVSGVLLYALGLYEPLLSFAGAGASVPLTGFGALLAKGTKLAVEQEGFLGVLKGGLSAASGGIAAAVFIALLMGIFFRPKRK